MNESRRQSPTKFEVEVSPHEARILLGNRKLMDAQQVDLNGLEEQAARLQGGGRTVVHVAQGNRLIGLISIADAVRPTSKTTIESCRSAA